MKSSKIFALALSAIMMCSSIASAADVITIGTNDDGDAAISAMPTKDDLMARKVSVAFGDSTEEISDTTLSGGKYKKLREALKSKYSLQDDQDVYNNFDVYAFSATVSNVGELVSGGTVEYDDVYCSLLALQIQMKTDKIKYLQTTSVVGSSENVFTGAMMTDPSRLDWFNIMWSDTNCYPSMSPTSVPKKIDAADYTVSGYIAVPDGTKAFEVKGDDLYAEVDYMIGVKGKADTAMVEASFTNTLKVGKTVEEDKWSVVIDNATGDMAATDDNKVWSVKPSKTGTPADIDKFDLTLKSGEDSVVKSINTADLNKIMNAWNTGFEFFIGFENVGNHENVTAAWDIAAGTAAIVPTGTAIN